MSETIQLQYDDGYKNIQLGDDPDRVIRINPTDVNFIKRFAALDVKAKEIREKYGDIDFESIADLQSLDPDTPDFEAMKKAADNIDRLDMALRELIDSAFETPVSDTVFGSSWCISPVHGMPKYLYFLEVIGEYISTEVDRENKVSAAKMQKYTDAAQQLQLNRQQRRELQKLNRSTEIKAKNTPFIPLDALEKKIDISSLSDEERKALMVQLINHS